MHKTVSSNLNFISNTLVARKQDRSWVNVCVLSHLFHLCNSYCLFAR